jgi:hypothetical protein
MLSKMSYLDMFGYSPHMQVNKQQSYQTVFGGFISIIVIFAIISAVWLFGKEIILKEKPGVIVSTYSDADPMQTQFNDENYVITLGLQDPDYTFYLNESIYKVELTHNTMMRSENNKVTFESKKIEVIRCSNKNITLLNDYFKLLDLNNLLCLKNGNFSLEGSFGRSIFTFLEFKFNRCKNSTENNFSCKSSQEIEKRLAGGFFGMFLTDITILPTNKTSPFQAYGVNIWTTFSIWAYREVWMYYKKIQVWSDKGWLFDDSNREDYFSFDKMREVWDTRDTSETFMSLNIAMGLSRQVFDRSYIKVQQIAANCGGIMKFLMLLGKLVTFYFSKLKFKSYLVDFYYDPGSIEESKVSGMNLRNEKSEVIKLKDVYSNPEKNKITLNSNNNILHLEKAKIINLDFNHKNSNHRSKGNLFI